MKVLEIVSLALELASAVLSIITIVMILKSRKSDAEEA